ncbi:MAG: M24 family metallopeptidase, partial [Deltaproteobacteria bacterium]|nr:M24 family metallopeptidase [Deltaproteobacteria bacterium]
MKNKSTKVRRNDPCPCGSGLKYKKCCLHKEGSLPNNNNKRLYLQKHGIRVKETRDIEGIKKAGRLALKTLDLVEDSIRVGMTTDDINTLVHDYTLKNGATPAPLGYRGFPKSVCVSVNEVICHGIPGDRVLR